MADNDKDIIESITKLIDRYIALLDNNVYNTASVRLDIADNIRNILEPLVIIKMIDQADVTCDDTNNDNSLLEICIGVLVCPRPKAGWLSMDFMIISQEPVAPFDRAMRGI